MNILKHYSNLLKYASRGNEGYYESRDYLAEVLIEELEEFIDLKRKKVLDIGGEKGDFCKVLALRKQCLALNLEPAKLPVGDFVWETVFGSADHLPFQDGSYDLVLLRGVIQHIPTRNKFKVFQEMRRVLKTKGLAYLMIPPWFNPLSGQDIKPFHYLPLPIARHLRNSVFNSQISAQNLGELGLWPMTYRSTLKLIKRSNFKVLKSIDIIFRLHFLTHVPLLSEILLPSVGFILQKS